MKLTRNANWIINEKSFAFEVDDIAGNLTISDKNGTVLDKLQLPMAEWQKIGIAVYLFVNKKEPTTRPKPKTARPDGSSSTGLPWLDVEDEKLRQGWARGLTLAHMANSHGRTPGAIASRLERLALDMKMPTNERQDHLTKTSR